MSGTRSPGRPGRIAWRGLGSALLTCLVLVVGIPAPRAAEDPAAWPVPADGALAHDPAVVWGRLENGVRYAILPNATPPGRVSLRLLVEAGSLMEAEDQRGLAHFLEHMAFKGSENLPPGELVRILQRAGLAFGPDTNAQTGFDTTTYQLDLPRNDAALVAQGIGILSEVAGRLLLAPDQIEPERGVILSERRLLDTPEMRRSQAELDFLLPGSLYADRDPIGTEEVIRTAPRERFAAFYRDWYTPERLVVVIVGEVEPDAVSAVIRARFGELAQPPDAPADPLPRPLREPGLKALLISDPGLPASVSFNRTIAYDDRPDSLESQRIWLRRMMASAMLNRRLESIGLRAGAPFTRAATGSYDLPPEATMVTLELQTEAESWRKALAAGEQQLRAALVHGFAEAELAEMLAILRSELETAAARAATRETPELADQLAEVIAEERVFTSPAADLVLLEELTRGLTVAEVDAALRELWAGSPPQIVVAGPIELAEPEAEILAAYEASRAVPVVPHAVEANAAFPYAAFAEPSAVITTEEIADVGITRVRFGNGVGLDLKPTPFEAGKIMVGVRFGTGRLGLPKDQPGLDLLARRAFVAGGLGRMSFEELVRSFAARQVEANLVVGDSSLTLTGTTDREDLPLQLALLAAYVADPGYRPEARERYLDDLTASYAGAAAVPEGAVDGPIAAFLHDGDLRFARPPQADAERRTMAELRAWLEPMLRDGPLQVVVVGDIDPAQVIAEVGRTFGALPPRPAELARPEPPRFSLPSAAEPVRFPHAGPDDQVLALVYWPTPGRVDAMTDIGLDLVADILADRLLEAVRDREGATYSPEAFSDRSWALPGFGQLVAALDVTAADAERLQGLILDVAAGMAAGGITQDELDRALQPRLAQARAALEDNGYWFYNVMLGFQQYPERLEDARRLMANHEAQTLAWVQELAMRHLDRARALPVLVVPEGRGGAGAAAGRPAPAAVAPAPG